MRHRRLAAGTVLAALVLLTGCSGRGGPESAPPGELTVFAAASLRSSFTEIGEQFEDDNPGSQVIFSFAGSSDLAAQLEQGAPADVFASADTRNMDKVAAAGLLSGSPQNFATNTMMIAVPPDNPAGITGFADLAEPGVQVVVCAPQVPCGAATKTVEANTGVTLAPVSEESSVTDVLNKVATGQADAGVVYVTDVAGSGGSVIGIGIPDEVNAINTYPIAVLDDSPSPGLAEDFLAFVLGPKGQQVLSDAGFGAP